MDENSVSDLLMKAKAAPVKLLNDYVKIIEESFNVNINIHDVIGVGSIVPSLEKLFVSHQYHNNPFCNNIKKNSSCLKLCILNKEKLCSKCKTTAKPFYGSCYMGIEEFIYPILCDKKLIAIICVGQFSHNINTKKELIEKNSKIYNFNNEEAEKYFMLTTKDMRLNIEKLNCYISMLSEHICLNLRLAIEEGTYSNSCEQNSNDFLAAHKNNFIINTTIQFIKENFDKDLTLETLASNCYCNPSYLSHIFKEKSNIGISEYINTIRIQEAKEMLDITSKSITEIGIRVGFNDLGYFGRVFKKIVGLTPKEYRAKKT